MLVEKGARLSCECYSVAGEYGNVHILDFLYEKYPQGFHTIIVSDIISAGQLEVLKWLKEKGKQFSVHDRKYSACRGQLEVLKWLMDDKSGDDFPIDWYCYRMTDVVEHPHILQYLFQIDPPSEAEAIRLLYFVAIGGHLKTLEWLHNTQGYNLNEAVFSAALNSNQLPVIHWLITQGCPMNMLLPDFDA